MPSNAANVFIEASQVYKDSSCPFYSPTAIHFVKMHLRWTRILIFVTHATQLLIIKCFEMDIFFCLENLELKGKCRLEEGTAAYDLNKTLSGEQSL